MIRNLARRLDRLVSVFTPSMSFYKFDTFVANYEFQRNQRKWRKEYDAIVFRVTPGTYINRSGRVVRVDHNPDNWYDGLAFIVFHENGERYYTVDDRGWAYPDRPKEGRTIQRTPLDLIARIGD